MSSDYALDGFFSEKSDVFMFGVEVHVIINEYMILFYILLFTRKISFYRNQ